DRPGRTDRTGGDITNVDLHDSFERLLELTRSSRRHAEFVQEAGLASGALTRGETFVLAAIIRDAPVRPSDLAVSLGVDRSIVSRQIDTLVRAGLVDRTPDPSDGRAALLVASSSGRSVNARLRTARANWLARVLATVEPAAVEELSRLLPILVGAMESAEEEAGTSSRSPAPPIR